MADFGQSNFGESVFGQNIWQSIFVLWSRSRWGYDSPRANTCTFQGPGSSNTTKIQRKDPQEREERMKFPAGDGKKSAKFWASHPSGPHPSPFGPPPLQAPIRTGPNPFRPTFHPNYTPTTLPQRTPHNEHPTPQKNWPNAVWPNSVNQNWPNSAKSGLAKCGRDLCPPW